MNTTTLSKKALETRARRAAHSVGLIAKKCRSRDGSVENLRGFMLFNSLGQFIDGANYGLTSDDVIEYAGRIRKGRGDAA